MLDSEAMRVDETITALARGRVSAAVDLAEYQRALMLVQQELEHPGPASPAMLLAALIREEGE